MGNAEPRADACAALTAPSHVSLYLGRLFLPLQDRVLAADLNPEKRAWLTAHLGKPIEETSRPALLAAIRQHHGGTLLDDAIFGLARRFPDLSAQTVITRTQAVAIGSLIAASLVTFALWPSNTAHVVMTTLTCLVFASTAFRLLLTLLANRPLAPAELTDIALPTYTILVPLYREATVLPDLVTGLLALDYPRHLLDIKLVVEEDDLETVVAANREAMRDTAVEVVAVPPGNPRTKPKAANYALSFARGEYLVVYDAEDCPQPDQLKKSVATFRASSRATACLQARLSFHNARHCWLTRLFDLDYQLWFGSLLPGLDRMGVPMPLGGTSNHFRTAVLRDIGGWDAFNVTEDADIGIRLSQLGYRVSMLDSTTFEEAPVAIGAWLKQRSRWLKGYMQTWLVHMRNPARLMRRTGLVGFLAFQLFIGGGVIFALINPLVWIAFLLALLLHVVAGAHGLEMGITGTGLLANNLLLIYLAASAPQKRGEPWSPYGLTVIAYWALVSAAGYRGAWQLITRPFYWEKTTHGVMPK